ncbi:ATP-binding protein [Siphonobacter aquaeclarae]|uniref:histidine kinase n=1 Tax=Siphonobacter aquaeclarae TaxID=563176 RepID=A0A1G9IFS6_9BACT|nr:ATP-binding protein [Siphonobacter aquaeclarae]SDL24069.1 His Kinase A (phospho-acceptor) domain-containing protein [Siphonobacter aquaeclarae]
MRASIRSLYLVLLVFYVFSAQSQTHESGVRQGVLDLKGKSLKETSVLLDGEWKWYWNRFKQPWEVDTDFEYIHFPTLWNNSTWKGQPIESQGFATYEMVIVHPAAGERLALNLPDVYSASRLFVNGRLVAQSGVPATSKDKSVPFWSFRAVPLPAADTIRLLLHVSNYRHSKGGPYQSIEIGDAAALASRDFIGQASDLFLTGCLFMGGLFFLGLFVFGQHDRAILYFSLFCLLYSYRIIGTDRYVLHSLFPFISWFITVRLEYLTLFLGVAMFVEYTRALYPLDGNPRILRAMTWLCFGFGLLVIVLPPILFTRLINPFLVLMFLYIGYAFYIYYIAARHHRPGANYALLSTGVLLTVFVAINLDYFGVSIVGKTLVFLGYILFFFLQSLILSFRFAYTLKQARQQAEEGLVAKSEFLSTMSHEIRTPLNSVIGMMNLLQAENPRPDQEHHLEVMQFSANHLMSIINDILDFNKIEAGKIRFESIPFDIRTLVRNTLESYRTYADEKKIDVHLRVDPSIQTLVIGDPTRTSQVLNNLVHNAIKFTQKGWIKLSVDTENQTDTQITLKITVEDTGIGIEPEKQRLIFDRFTQADSSMNRSFGGTGLGLAICKNLLALQGIELHLDSTPGRGSAFYFLQTFQKSSQPVPEAQTPVKVLNEKALEGVPILLVDDQPMNILAARGILKRWGAIVDVAINGQEALEKLESTKPFLVLMDLQMPILNGYEATKQLRARGINVPIVALTASLVPEIEDKVREAGLNDIVLKPFNPQELLRVILKYTEH